MSWTSCQTTNWSDRIIMMNHVYQEVVRYVCYYVKYNIYSPKVTGLLRLFLYVFCVSCPGLTTCLLFHGLCWYYIYIADDPRVWYSKYGSYLGTTAWFRPDTKPLPDNVDFSPNVFRDIHPSAISQEGPMNLIGVFRDYILKITSTSPSGECV